MIFITKHIISHKLSWLYSPYVNKEEVEVSKQTVYRVLRPNKAKEHREADMTRYYKGKGKTPTSAKPPKRATFDDDGGQKRKSD